MTFLHNLTKCSMKVTSLAIARSLDSVSGGCSRLTPRSIAHQFLRTLSYGTQLRQEVKVTFVRTNGETIHAPGKVGETLLDVVVNNQIDLDGYGACEGALSCSTCHLIFKASDYDKLPDKPGDEELDMLDFAYELTDTSRLGCQVTLTKDMDGLTVSVPATINDARSA